MLDPANHTNAADGFSASEIRAAFLRFFVSVFRGYLAHVVMPTNASPYPQKLFQKEAFLKSSGHLVMFNFFCLFLATYARGMCLREAVHRRDRFSGLVSQCDNG